MFGLVYIELARCSANLLPEGKEHAGAKAPRAFSANENPAKALRMRYEVLVA